MRDSFLKINEKLSGALAYVLGPATGLIFYIGESVTGNNNSFVKFHGLQSTIFFGAIMIIRFILNLIRFVPFMGLIISILNFVAVLSYILLIYMAFTGKTFKIPVIGDACYNQVYK